MTEEYATPEQIEHLRTLVESMRLPDPPERTPPWKTPEAKAARARRKRNRGQRQARKVSRRS